MRRRPQEQCNRQHGRDHLRRRIDGRRSGQHRETSGKAADHDVPGAAALQPDRIDDAVGEGAEEDIGRRDVACGDRGKPERCREQPEKSDQPPRAWLERSARERARAGAPHQPVDVTLIVVVEGARRARCAEDRQREAHDLPPRQPRPARDRDAGERTRRNRDADPEFQERNRQSDCGAHGFPP